MHLSYIIYLLFVYFNQLITAKDTVPVLITDYANILENFNIESNPFNRTDSLIFLDMIEEIRKRCSIVIIFIEEKFCNEDVSIKDAKGTPYARLKQGLAEERVKYLPSVVNPTSLLAQVLVQSPSNVFTIKVGQYFQPTADLKFFYVFFEDGKDETRVDSLRRHDSEMYEVYHTTRKMADGPVVAIYTGKINPITLSDYENDIAFGDPFDQPSEGVYVASEGALFHFIGMSMEMETPTRRSMQFADIPLVTTEYRYPTPSGTEYMKTYMEYQGFHIKFSFSLSDEYWSLDNVTLLDGGENMGTTFVGIRVPIYNSYYCDEPLIIVNENDNSYISIPEYQIQAFQSTGHIHDDAPIGPDDYPDNSDPFSYRPPGVPEIQTVRLKRDRYFPDFGLGDPAPPPPPPPPPQKNPDEGGNDPGGSHPAGSDQAGGGGTGPDITDPSKPISKNFSGPVKCNPYFDIPILTGLFVSAICLAILMFGVILLFNCQTNDHYDDPRSGSIMVSADAAD